MSIEGTWRSRYEYTQGADNTPHISEHQVTFSHENNMWVGQSTAQPDGSQLTITLSQNGSTFSGAWLEHTSPTGDYQGREFRGLLLLLQNNEDRLEGKWLGESQTTHTVKVGEWTLRRMETEG